jgi:hypothetical protein
MPRIHAGCHVGTAMSHRIPRHMCAGERQRMWGSGRGQGEECRERARKLQAYGRGPLPVAVKDVECLLGRKVLELHEDVRVPEEDARHELVEHAVVAASSQRSPATPNSVQATYGSPLCTPRQHRQRRRRMVRLRTALSKPSFASRAACAPRTPPCTQRSTTSSMDVPVRRFLSAL